VQTLLYDETLHSKIRKTVTLDELPEAIQEYIGQMSGGKIIVTPNK